MTFLASFGFAEIDKWILSSDIGARKKCKLRRYILMWHIESPNQKKIIESFNNTSEKISKKCIIQISMDDPTTNWNFYKRMS